MSVPLEKIEDIAIIEINLKEREIVIWNHDGTRLTGENRMHKYAKSSPGGLIIQALTRMVFNAVKYDLEP